jgi:importin-5
MVRKVPGWTDVIVRACLEGMGEDDEDETEKSGLEIWLREDVSNLFWFRCICAWIDVRGL